jgi:stress response protein SCP2
MSVPLVKGQNTVLAANRLRITVDVASPADLSALLLAATGRVRSSADFAFYNQPDAAGVSWRGSATGPQHLEVDLAAVPPEVERILAVVSLDDAGAAFGALAAPTARLADASGNELGQFPMAGLGAERAVIAWELYRRAGTWKVRAVGQGYDGGLAQLVTAYGVEVDDPGPPSAPAASVNSDSAVGGVVPAGPAIGPSSEERLYNRVWKIFEDAARATSALRAATGYAELRRDNEVDQLLSDPRTRNSAQTEAARALAERRHDELVARADADYRRDIGQLSDEIAEVGAVLPAPMAAWDNPAWTAWRPGAEPAYALRVGDLHIAEAPGLRIPMVFRLPLQTPLWIDSGDGKRGAATAVARALVVRVLAAYPPGEMKVHVADLVGAGAAAKALQPLGGGVVQPPATNPGELSEALGRLVERIDLIQMARQAQAMDTLAGRIDAGRQLLVLHDFPFGFDERALAQLRFLIDEGPAAGVHLLFVADPSDASTLGPLVSSLWRTMLRLSATADDHIGDPWVGLTWTYTPDIGAAGPVVDTVLTRLADRTH